MQIWRLGIGDERLAAKAVRSLKAERVNYNYLRGFLKKETNILLVALDGVTPVGFLLAYELDRIDNPNSMMLLYEIMVDENHRRQGVAKAMITALKNICRERSIVKMWVLTNEANHAAMRTYESTGGEKMEEDDLVMFQYLSDAYY
jgi:ribosomal protein S18 acetylase RimI-like enzyme